MNNSQETANAWNDRFSGIARLYGEASVKTLQNAHIAVVGIGGVGSWAAEALARSGIGRLTLIDLDDICISNTNRQLHTGSKTLGQFKSDVMQERILDINPECQVTVINDFITPHNVATHIHAELDGVIDAIDSVQAKAALIHQCKRIKTPVIVTGGAGAQIDPTKIQITDLSRTTNDPLLAKTRSVLRRNHGFSKSRHLSIPCVYSTEQLRYPQPDGSVSQNKPKQMTGTGLNCAGGFGAITMVTGTFGFVASSKIIEKILQKNQF